MEVRVICSFCWQDSAQVGHKVVPLSSGVCQRALLHSVEVHLEVIGMSLAPV